MTVFQDLHRAADAAHRLVEAVDAVWLSRSVVQTGPPHYPHEL